MKIEEDMNPSSSLIGSCSCVKLNDVFISYNLQEKNCHQVNASKNQILLYQSFTGSINTFEKSYLIKLSKLVNENRSFKVKRY